MSAERDPYVCPRCGTAARGASTCVGCGADLDAYPELPRASEQAAGGLRALSAEYNGQRAAQAGAPGGVVIRWVAAVIDNVVGLGLAGLGLLAGAAAGAPEVGSGLAYLTWLLLYAPLMLALAGGQTLGKRAMGLRVRGLDAGPPGFGRSFLRESVVKLGFSVLVIPLIVDTTVAAADPERVSLHDRIARTRVVTAA